VVVAQGHPSVGTIEMMGSSRREQPVPGGRVADRADHLDLGHRHQRYRAATCCRSHGCGQGDRRWSSALYADVRLAEEFERFRVSTRHQQQLLLLTRVTAALR